MVDDVTRKQLRSFAFTVGGIFALIALWPVIIHDDDPRWWAVIVTACLIVPGAIFPGRLRAIYKGWTALGHMLGWINTRIILSLVFYLVVTPIGIWRRWLGKDPMGRKLPPDLDSYRVISNSRPASHLKKQY